MAQNTTIKIPAKTWTLLTDSDVTAVSFQNQSSVHVMIAATTSATPPTDLTGAIRYNPGQGERNATVANLWLGLSSPDRLYAWAEDPAQIWISHA